MITTSEILALAPGPALDEAVARFVFQQAAGLAPAFSTDPAAGAELLAKLPSLFVSRTEKPKDPAKPWIAGQLASDPSSTAWHTTMIVTGSTMLGVLCRAALLVAVKAPPQPPEKPVSVPRAGRAPVQPTRRPATKRANGAPVPVSTPISAPVAPIAKERPVQVVRQPSIFLNARAKLAPMPKRKPFTMPGDPAK